MILICMILFSVHAKKLVDTSSRLDCAGHNRLVYFFQAIEQHYIALLQDSFHEFALYHVTLYFSFEMLLSIIF